MLDAASERGFTRFVAHVLTHNLATRKLLRRVGDILAVTIAGGVSELTFVRRPRTL